MLFKVVIVALAAFSAVSADIDSITVNMRKVLVWVHDHSPHDKNSTFTLADASGSIARQCLMDEGIESQVQATYLALAVALSKEMLFNTDPEARMYFTVKQFEFVGSFSPEKVVKTNPVTDSPTIYEIWARSQQNELYKKCVDEFYKNNLKPKNPASECVISEKCKDAMLEPSKGIGAVLRTRYIGIAHDLHKCTNFKESYDTIIAGQMQELNDEITTYLEYISKNDGKLDPRLRYSFLRKVVMMLLNGYNVLSPKIETYVNSLINTEGYCGVAEDVDIDKVVLSAQCYAILAFQRQLLMEEMKTSEN